MALQNGKVTHKDEHMALVLDVSEKDRLGQLSLSESDGHERHTNTWKRKAVTKGLVFLLVGAMATVLVFAVKEKSSNQDDRKGLHARGLQDIGVPSPTPSTTTIFTKGETTTTIPTTTIHTTSETTTTIPTTDVSPSENGIESDDADDDENDDANSDGKKDSSCSSVCTKPACVKAAAEILESMDVRVDPWDDFYEFACGGWMRSRVLPGFLSPAADILKSMDQRVDPCNDFYEFACGGWMRNRVLPADTGHYAAYSELRNDVNIKLKGLLEEYKDNDITSVRNAKNMYHACTNEELIESRNMSGIFTLLDDLGGWPILGCGDGGGWRKSRYSLVDLVVGLQSYNNVPLFNVWVGMDDRNNSKNVIFVDQVWLGMGATDFYVNEKHASKKAAYATLIRNAAIMFGSEVTDLESQVNDIVEFETELSKIIVPVKERRDVNTLYHPITIADLQKNYSDAYTNIKFDWLSYIKKLLALTDDNVTITTEEVVILQGRAYYQNLFPLLNSTQAKTVANYLIWRIVKNRLSNMPVRFREEVQKFSSVMYGSSVPSPRWKTCARYLKNPFSMVVGRLFVEQYFGKESKSEVLAMINNVRVAFKEMINELDWMDAEMKEVAKEKADYMVEVIGYPDNIFNDDHLNTQHEELKIPVAWPPVPVILRDTQTRSITGTGTEAKNTSSSLLSPPSPPGLTMNPDTYFENILRVLQFDGKTGLNDLRKVNDLSSERRKWLTSPTVVNAFYHHQRNMITFPAAILQPSYFHVDHPRYMNYGGIGFMIGHEITHGFDDVGRQYDKVGNLNDWWKPSAAELYKAKGECIINQYGNFTDPEAGMKLNARQNQGENIADNGGVKETYKAYRSFIEANGGKEEMPLPGLNFTPNQLFFLNFAQIRCALSSKAGAISHILNGVHSPNRFRVIGSLQNMPEFSEVFQCPSGSNMNPKKKCAVW